MNMRRGACLLFAMLGFIAHADRVDAQASASDGRPAPVEVTDVEVASVPAPDGWKIESVGFAGAGCPASRPNFSSIATEGDDFGVEFTGFRVEVAPTDLRPAVSTSCTMRVGIHVPHGYAYAPTHLRFEGRSYLPSGVSASLMTTYGFQGSGLSTEYVTHRLGTPSTFESFCVRDDLATTPNGLRWSDCGEQQLLNVNMVLHIQNPSAQPQAWVALSYLTGLRLAWKRCE